MFKGKKRPAADGPELEAATLDESAAEGHAERAEPIVRKITVLDADEAAAIKPKIAEKPGALKASETPEAPEATIEPEPVIAAEPKGAPPVEPEMLKVLHIPGETDESERPTHHKVADEPGDEDEWDDEWDEDEDDDEPQLPFGKRLLRGVRNAAISVVILAAVLIGAGAGYTYFMGGNNSTPTIAPVATTAPDPTEGMVKPHKPSPKAPESASIQFLTSPVKRGGTVSLSVKTQPTSACTVIVDHDHIAYKVAGLKKQTADDFGTVNWEWTMPKTAPAGNSTVTVNCTFHGRGAMVQGDIIVKP